MEANRISSIDPAPVSVPGTKTAGAVDTARAEVNAAQFMTAMMSPSSDGIQAIAAVAHKVTDAIKAVAKMHWSSWGF